MKQTLTMALLVLVAGSSVAADVDMMKRYGIKSAKITFEIKGGGTMMGMMESKTKGKKRLIFDSYGAREIMEIAKVTQETINGKSTVKKVHSMQYMNGGILYSVNFKKKKITRSKNPALATSALFGGGKNMVQTGKSMLQKMGGKMIGKDKVLGYRCEVWSLMGTQQCIYKGITLRTVSDIMGIRSSEVATDIQFDVSLDKSDFKLPEYPIVDRRGRVMEMDREVRDTIDSKESAATIKQANDAATAMAAGLNALVASGANLSSNKDLTPEQEQAMQKAMMTAMGGEKSMLAKQKQEIMADFKKMPQAKACFEKARNVVDANACEKAIDSEEPKYHTYWSKKEKTKILREIKAFESAAPCIRAAQSFSALRQCMPH